MVVVMPLLKRKVLLSTVRLVLALLLLLLLLLCVPSPRCRVDVGVT